MSAKQNSDDNQCGIRPCTGCDGKSIDRCMTMCMNCRKAVEESLTRVAGRKLRKLMALPECSAERCAAFLATVTEKDMRLHLASMAWWRFSSDDTHDSAPVIHSIMAECNKEELPTFGLPYMHKVLKAVSKLSQEQLAAWFGIENLYQLAELFSGGLEEADGSHCKTCRLYKLGCTAHGTIGAENCKLWDDRFVQDVAASLARTAGVWRDPCKGIKGE